MLTCSLRTPRICSDNIILMLLRIFFQLFDYINTRIIININIFTYSIANESQSIANVIFTVEVNILFMKLGRKGIDTNYNSPLISTRWIYFQENLTEVTIIDEARVTRMKNKYQTKDEK